MSQERGHEGLCREALIRHLTRTLTSKTRTHTLAGKPPSRQMAKSRDSLREMKYSMLFAKRERRATQLTTRPCTRLLTRTSSNKCKTERSEISKESSNSSECGNETNRNKNRERKNPPKRSHFILFPLHKKRKMLHSNTKTLFDSSKQQVRVIELL